MIPRLILAKTKSNGKFKTYRNIMKYENKLYYENCLTCDEPLEYWIDNIKTVRPILHYHLPCGTDHKIKENQPTNAEPTILGKDMGVIM